MNDPLGVRLFVDDVELELVRVSEGERDNDRVDVFDSDAVGLKVLVLELLDV